MKTHHVKLLAGVAVLASLAVAPAFAADAPAAGDQALAQSDIVVTATKRSERLLDVPAAITAISGAQIVAIGAHSTRDLINFVPGLAFQSDGIRNTPIIRGISAGSISTPVVGTIIDGVPYGSTSGVAFGGTSAINLNLADVERVEVLKGPQGTLYGASAMGGLLSYVLRSNIPTKIEASASAETFDTAHGKMSYLVEGAIAAPIVADKVGLRLSAFYNDLGGFIDNPRTGDKDANEDIMKGGRAALDLRPTEKLRIDLSAIYQKESLSAFNAAYYQLNRTPLIADYTSNFAVLPVSKRTFQQYTGRVAQDLGFASLTSLTSWAKVDTSATSDVTDNTFGPLFRSINPAAVTAFQRNQPTTKKFTEELRLASSNSTGIRWLLGGFYTRETSYLNQVFYGATARGLALVAPFTPAVAILVPSTYKEYSAFGNVTVAIGRLELTGGARYSHNDQFFQQNAVGPLAAAFGLAAFGPLNNSSANRFDYSGSIKYKLGGSAMLYARIASGYRPGGPNVSFVGVPPSYAADNLVNYEAGFKSSFLGGRGSIDIAGFYIDWRNIQVTAANAAGQGYFANGGKARSQGFEASASLRPVTGLSLTGTLAFTDATLRQDIPSLFGKAGDRLSNSPKWNGALVADYSAPLTDAVIGVLGANFQYVGSRVNSFPANLIQRNYLMKAYSQIDVRAGIETGPISVTAFVRNLANKRADLSTTYQAPIFQVTQLRPRQIGLRLGVKY